MSSLLNRQAFEALMAYDHSQLLNTTSQCATSAEQHYQNAQALTLPAPYLTPRQILVCGMGGSGTCGDFLQLFTYKSAKIPVLISKGPQIPSWVNSETLVICVSYSGNTAETLACFEQAQAQAAMILGLATGGELQQRCQAANLPCLAILPGKLPRAALFDLVFSLLAVLKPLPALGLDSLPIEAGLQCLQSCTKIWHLSPALPEPLPFKIAQALLNQTIHCWGVYAQTDYIALRWKNQFSENSKQGANYNHFPELNHNEIVNMCAEHHSETTVLYFNLDPNNRWHLRNQLSLEMLQDKVKTMIRLEAQGNSFFEKQLYLTYLGDYVSIYLALLQGIDPSPIDAIETLKLKTADQGL